MTSESELAPTSYEGTFVDTLQSLIVAFVLAMTFRGFVTEGFVIPTGSMAPTLLGQHVLVHSNQTGIDFPVGLDQSDLRRLNRQQIDQRLADPMLGPEYAGFGSSNVSPRIRMGDRILVLKCFYPFLGPDRFDVVVFKNPTDPTGETQNYIKRLIGLPNEQVWLVDGDVFTERAGESDFHMQRKPEHVQRAVWRPVFNSDYEPVNPTQLEEQTGDTYRNPWVGNTAQWTFGHRVYETSSADPTVLIWDTHRRDLTDWTPYNMLAGTPVLYPVSDLRVAAALTAKNSDWSTTLELETREHTLQFRLQSGKATLRIRPTDDETWSMTREAPFTLPDPGEVMNVEFWHVDQSMRVFVDGELATEPLNYDWSPLKRLQQASGRTDDDDVDDLIRRTATTPTIQWHFRGSPIKLERIRVDRDIHYRFDSLDRSHSRSKNTPYIHGPAFGTHPDINAAILGPDQFMMLGDNSQMSLDSRLWGSPHDLAKLIDPSPFVVNRKLLLGKAWVVYFPSPFSATEQGWRFIPDFGRLRFIR